MSVIPSIEQHLNEIKVRNTSFLTVKFTEDLFFSIFSDAFTKGRVAKDLQINLFNYLFFLKKGNQIVFY